MGHKVSRGLGISVSQIISISHTLYSLETYLPFHLLGNVVYALPRPSSHISHPSKHHMPHAWRDRHRALDRLYGKDVFMERHSRQ